jgi:hypothetical protein
MHKEIGRHKMHVFGIFAPAHYHSCKSDKQVVGRPANVEWPFRAIAEAYPALWAGALPADRNADQHDAYSIAAWIARADRDGSINAFLKPALTPAERAAAQVEGMDARGWLERAAAMARRLKPRTVPNVVRRPRSTAVLGVGCGAGKMAFWNAISCRVCRIHVARRCGAPL